MVEENQNRKKRIKTIKKIIILVVVFLLLFPTCLCILLMFKVHKLEGEVNEYKEAVKLALSEKENSQGIDLLDKAMDIAVSIDEDAQEENSDAKEKADELLDNAKNEEAKEEKDNTDNKKDKKDIPEGAKRIYLTFDDGPSPYTSQLLDVLKENDVQVTFFCIGHDSDEDKKNIKRMYDEGHTVAMHSYTHDYGKIYASAAAFEKDFNDIRDLLKSITGEEPKYYRFPGGSSNQVNELGIQTYIDVLDEKGVKYIDWNAANMDATGAILTENELIDNILEGVESLNTAVVLMHDTAAKETTIKSIPKLIRELKKRGYVLLPIDEDTPLIQHVEDKNGKQ